MREQFYAQMARCLHEYQLSAEQEKALRADAEFARWYQGELARVQ